MQTTYTACFLNAQGREIGRSATFETLLEAQETGRRLCRNNRRYATFYVREITFHCLGEREPNPLQTTYAQRNQELAD